MFGKGVLPLPSHSVSAEFRQRIVKVAHCLFVLWILWSPTGCDKDHAGNPPPHIHYKPLPHLKPVPLQTGTVDSFVDWVSAIPSSQVQDVKDEIAKSANDPAVIDAVASRLSFKAPISYGRQVILLSILGETKNPRAIAPLGSFLNSSDCLVFEQITAAGLSKNRVVAPNSTSYLDSCAALKSSAANMISYINTDAANEIVLATMQTHPSRAVRLSAANAYLYNHNDSTEAMAEAARYVRQSESKLLGMARLDGQSSRQAFDEKVAAFYRDHPEEVAQVPSHITKPPGPPPPPHARTPTGPRAGAANPSGGAQ